MAVFRIEKNRDYTVMSNHHLRNTNLSLKAKGLLSLMLSLPEDWDYTAKGLAKICKDGTDSIYSAIKELEQAGHIVRKRVRNQKGQLTTVEYTILEQPIAISPTQEKPTQEKPTQEKPTQEKPIQEKPIQEKPIQENPAQLNTNQSNIQELNKNESNTYPIQSDKIESVLRNDTIGYDEITLYKEVIKENISYDSLTIQFRQDIAMLDEIVDLIAETVCTTKKELIIAGDNYPAIFVKTKFLKLNAIHIEYVMDCMTRNTSKVRNVKKYLLTALFNAPSTVNIYRTLEVNHDLYGKRE